MDAVKTSRNLTKWLTKYDTTHKFAISKIVSNKRSPWCYGLTTPHTPLVVAATWRREYLNSYYEDWLQE